MAQPLRGTKAARNLIVAVLVLGASAVAAADMDRWERAARAVVEGCSEAGEDIAHRPSRDRLGAAGALTRIWQGGCVGPEAKTLTIVCTGKLGPDTPPPDCFIR